MNTLDLLNCARPILFENDDEEFKYSLGGTAFIVKFRNHLYVITAKHVLTSFSKQEKDFSWWKQFQVQYYPDKTGYIPMTALYVIEHEITDDTDQFDLAIFQVDDIKQNKKLFQNHQPYELLESEGFTAFNSNSKFIFRGFPSEQRSICYEKKQIHHSAFRGEGEYLEHTEYTNIHKLKLKGKSLLTTLNGLSGSPIFQINEKSQEAFAGVLIRGSSESTLAYFLEHKCIIDAERYDKKSCT